MACVRRSAALTSSRRPTAVGHVLAKGVDLTAFFAELMRRASGACGGFGGSMHIASVDAGVFGANGIVGAGLPIAAGAALSIHQQGSDRVAAAVDAAVTTARAPGAPEPDPARIRAVVLARDYSAQGAPTAPPAGDAMLDQPGAARRTRRCDGGRRASLHAGDRCRPRRRGVRHLSWTARALSRSGVTRPAPRPPSSAGRSVRPSKAGPGCRADVPRLRRRVLRSVAQPGGQAAVHDRGQVAVGLTVRTQLGISRSSGSRTRKVSRRCWPTFRVSWWSCRRRSRTTTGSCARPSTHPILLYSWRTACCTNAVAPAHPWGTARRSASPAPLASALISLSSPHRPRRGQPWWQPTRLAAEGIECEVIDLRTISPWDHTAVVTSVARTGRLVTYTEAAEPFGIGAEINAVVAAEGFWTLDAPARRLAGSRHRCPTVPRLERAWLPSFERLETLIREIVHV